MGTEKKLILIGASTGGPGHLKKIFTSLGREFKTPIVVAQHMNEAFVSSFVKQFSDELDKKVVLVNKREKIVNDTLYVCAKSCKFLKEHRELFLEDAIFCKSYFNPSIDLLFNSALNLVGEYKILAVLLTGIGSDGAISLSELQKKGACCVAESEKSAIVYGMPKVAKELNKDIEILCLDSIIEKMKNF